MIEPSSTPHWFTAQYFLDIGQPARALELLQSPQSEEINTPFFWYLRGRALYDLERYKEALETTKKGLALAPDTIYLLYLLCNCYSHFGNLAAAEQAILTALRQSPEDPQLLCRYAVLVMQGDQLEKAARLLEQATQLNPEHPAVGRTRITLAYLRGDDHQAEALGRSNLSQNPDDLYGHYMVGHSLSAQGRIGEANRHFQTAVRSDPMNEAYRASARTNRLVTHWLLWPLRPIYRFGPITVWFIAIATLFALRQLGFTEAAGIFAIVYLVYVIYSWVVPPLLRWWIQRQYQ